VIINFNYIIKYMEPEEASPFDDPEEQAHFKQVVSAFFNYSVSLPNEYLGRCNEGCCAYGKRLR
jgi:hypothetical protein